MKIKKRAAFQTHSRLRLPDVTFCFTRGSANAGFIGKVALDGVE